MTTKPIVSIVIPVFNVELFISETIQSALNQKYPNFEIVIIDDGSTDNSLSICQEYSRIDNRVKVVHTENRGVSSARNLGIEMANGEYLLFLDSDDVIVPNLLEVCIDKAMEYPESDIVLFGMMFEFHNKKKITRKEKTITHNEIFTTSELPMYFEELFNNNYLASSCNKLIKSSLLKKNKLYFNENISYLEDFCFSLDLIKCANVIVALRDPLYVYIHRRRLSLSLKYKKNMNEMAYYIFNEVNKFFKIVQVNKQSKARVYAFMLYVVSVCVINEINSKNNFKKKLINIIEFLEEDWIQFLLNQPHSLSKFNSLFKYLAIKKKYKSLFLLCKIKQMIINGGRN